MFGGCDVHDVHDVLAGRATAELDPGTGLVAVAGQEFVLPDLGGVPGLVPEIRHRWGVEDVQHHQVDPGVGEQPDRLGDPSRRLGVPSSGMRARLISCATAREPLARE
jgi:hypothetical protein